MWHPALSRKPPRLEPGRVWASGSGPACSEPALPAGNTESLVLPGTSVVLGPW